MIDETRNTDHVTTDEYKERLNRARTSFVRDKALQPIQRRDPKRSPFLSLYKRG